MPRQRDQDRPRVCRQVHPDHARHGEGLDQEGDRHHESSPPQQTDQPARRF